MTDVPSVDSQSSLYCTIQSREAGSYLQCKIIYRIDLSVVTSDDQYLSCNSNRLPTNLQKRKAYLSNGTEANFTKWCDDCNKSRHHVILVAYKASERIKDGFGTREKNDRNYGALCQLPAYGTPQ